MAPTTLTSTYPTPHILEVRDGYQTMSVAVAHVRHWWNELQQPTAPYQSRTWTFDSQGAPVWSEKHQHHFPRHTRNVVRYDQTGVIWQQFYELPGAGHVRKEVCWNRSELCRVLRAAVVASALSTQRAGSRTAI